MRPVELPQDEFVHPDSNNEWWYFFASLRERGGSRTYHYTAAVMRWRMAWVGYMRWLTAEDPSALHRIRYAQWPHQITGDRMSLGDEAEWGISLNRFGNSTHQVGPLVRLSFSPKGGACLHTTPEEGGIRQYGGDNELAWYSRPSLDVVGRVQEAGQAVPVEGIGWFEHQWGNTDGRKLIWRYVPVLLDDGRRLIAFSYGHKDFPGTRTTQVALLENGFATPLPDLTIVPTATGGRLTKIVDSQGRGLEVVSDEGLVDLNMPFIVDPFFEGPSKVSGTLQGTKVQGIAITEYHPA